MTKCPHCHRRVYPRTEGVAHVAHLLGTLLTCGLWMPIWVGAAAAAALRRSCPACGAGL